MSRRLLPLVVLASLVPAVALALPPAQRPPSSECRAFSGANGPVRVQWQAPTRTEGCFFFSGPHDLGRDDHLGASAEWNRNGDRVTLRFGAAVFHGTIRGTDVRLTRSSQHDYSGRWDVTETIEGSFTGDGCARLVGRYHYAECGRGSECPGHCHIDAALTLEGG